MNTVLRATALSLAALFADPSFGGASGGGFPVDGLILTDQATCPVGWNEVVEHQGRYIAAKAATGSANDTLGAAIPTTTTDSSGSTYSVTGTNMVTTAGTAPGATNMGSGALAVGANTVTPPATRRSSIMPNASFRLCKKALAPAWRFAASSLSLAPVEGHGTPPIVRAGNTATRVDATGTIVAVNANLPRFDYDPVTLALRGLLVEETRTNLLLRSAEADNTIWIKIASSVTANATTAPDGTSAADKIVEDNTANTHYIYEDVTKAASSLTYTCSGFYKPAGRSWMGMDLQDGGGNGFNQFFNVSTGAIGSVTPFGSGFPVTAARIEPWNNGWYYVSVSTTSNTATTIRCISLTAQVDGVSGYTGDGVSGIYQWGMQLEQASFPTSYVPTTSAAVTRNTDDIQQGISSMPGVSGTAGTVVARFRLHYAHETAVNTPVPLSLTIAGYADYALPYVASGPNGAFIFVQANVERASFTNLGAFTFNAYHTIVGRYAVNNFAAVMDGGTIQTDTSGAAPTAVDTFGLGGTPGVTYEYINGWITDASIYPIPLSDYDIYNLSRQ